MSKTFKEKVQQNIIIPAWKIIRDDSTVKKFYVIPGILGVIFLSGVLVYQSIYTYVKLFGKQEETLKFLLVIIESKYMIEIVIVVVIFLLLYFLLSPIFEAGLIKYLDLKNKGKELSKLETFGQGIYKFLPMFEYSNFFSEFKLLSILNFYLFTIRFVGIEYIRAVTFTYIVIFLIGIIINVLFVYTKYFIIIENKSIFHSIGESSKLSILNPKQTIRLYFLILFLNLRVILNFIAFLFFPIFIAVALTLITSKFLLIIAITIITIVFMSLILFLGYLTAVLDIFRTSLWYYAYLDGKKMIEDDKE